MDLKDTIFLPNTNFPMRGNLSVKELEILKYWDEIDLYQERVKTANKNKKFILHDGPPFANGLPHAGTALNRVLKDIILKTKWMRGYFSPFIPGWDCHGLPIEWKVEEGLKNDNINRADISIVDFRKKCANFAKYWIGKQKDGFKRLGTLGEWNNPYLTMDKKAESTIVKLIGKFLLDGTIYRGEKPVYWSVVEKTALADAEIEYIDKISTSIHVAFRIKTCTKEDLNGAYVVIWTTTPWTIPANRAISFLKTATYVVIEANSKKLIVANDLLEKFKQETGIENYTILSTVSGEVFVNAICEHPLYEKGYDFPVYMLSGQHVTLDTGTGFVHTAPGHGLDDFLICKEHSIPVPKTVSEEGVYYDEVPLFAGLHIFKAENKILDELRSVDALIAESKIKHSYPHSWRSKAPLIFRTTPQWFISLDNTGLRKKALEEVEKVEWLPSQGYNRIKSFIENRGDWCISRQRVWGTPLPIFINKKTGEALKDQYVIDRISKIFEEEGANSWYSKNPQEFLGDKYSVDDYIQSKDTVDVWFESASSNVFVLQKNPILSDVADLYLEGSDQHRGWFQHSLLVSCVANSRAPFKSVLTHGFVIDEKGRKMSKSLGNTVDLPTLISSIGADVFRLCVANCDFTGDFKLGDNIIKQCQDSYKKIRNTIRYMLGALNNFDLDTQLNYASIPDLEKYILHKIYSINKELMECVDTLDINRYFSTIVLFCNNELSSYFFDIRKDCLYCDGINSKKRKDYLSTLKIVFDFVIRWLSPVLAFTCEEAWLTLYRGSSVHLQKYLEPDFAWNNDEVAKKMEKLKIVRKCITEALEIARKNKTIGSSLQAEVLICDKNNLIDVSNKEILEELCIVSSIKFIDTTVNKDSRYFSDELPEVSIEVVIATGHKCERCWKICQTVNENFVCDRCAAVLDEINNE